MCKAFSCIVDKNKRVYWKLNLDSHDKIISEFKLNEKKDSLSFVRVEVSPKNSSYLKPDKWVFKVDEDSIPDWFSPSHKDVVMREFKVFKRELYKIVVRKPIVHPFHLKAVRRVSLKQKLLLKQWDSVRGSVGGSVGGSVWDSVRGSVGGSVRDSVWDSVGGSVRGSVGGSVRGYIGSFFKLERSQWKYTDKIKTSGYPFQSVVDLWGMGLVPSFDGTTWRLHAGEKAKVVFSIKKEDLVKLKGADNL